MRYVSELALLACASQRQKLIETGQRIMRPSGAACRIDLLRGQPATQHRDVVVDDALQVDQHLGLGHGGHDQVCGRACHEPAEGQRRRDLPTLFVQPQRELTEQNPRR